MAEWSIAAVLKTAKAKHLRGFESLPLRQAESDLIVDQAKQELIKLAIWTVVIGGLFAFAWWKGWLKRISIYSQETREELKKCTWPSKAELKGSTVVIIIASLLIGLMTVAADFIFTLVVSQFIMKL